MLYTPTFIAMALANFFVLSSFSSFFLLPLFVSDRGGSQLDVGIIMGAFALSSVLCRPWVSEMVDRIGRKRSFTLGSILMALLPPVYLSFEGHLAAFYLPLLAVRIVHGVGLAICITAAFTYAADIIPDDRRNEGIGMFGISGLTGMAVGPVIGELVIRRFGFHSFFLVAAGMAVLAVLIHLPLRESYVAGGGVTSESFFSVLRKRKVLTVVVMAVLFGFGIAASSSFVSPFASERRIAFISLYYISYSTAAVLTRLIGGRLADRIGEDRIIPYALSLAGAGLLVLIPLSGNATLILSGLMTGCGHGFLFPSLNAMALRGEPTEIRGKITGAFTGSIDAGTFNGSIILGYIGEWAGFQVLFLAAGMILLSGVGLYKFRLLNP